jgi:hypothetical protein
MKRERTAAEKWNALVDFATEADAPGEEEKAKSLAEVKEALEAKGVDVEARLAKARAEHEAAISSSTATATATSTSSSNVVTLAPRRTSRWVVLLAASFSFAALFAFEGSAILAWLHVLDPNTMVGSGRDAAGESAERAKAMRRGAAAALDAGKWRESIELLDQAKALDPAGDETPEATRIREAAREGLEKGSGPGR